MNHPPKHFTAAQIGRAIGRNRHSICRPLAGIQADGGATAGGTVADVWSLATLPADLRNELETSAQTRGFRNAENLLSNPPEIWRSTVPLADVTPGAIGKAVKLQRALARVLERRNDSTITATELERIGIADYSREFGHTITARHFSRLLDRTLMRDSGMCDFSRLEIYLPENPPRKDKAAPALTAAVETQFRRLREEMAAFKNPAAPSLTEKSFLWLCAFELYDESLSKGKAPKKVKRALLSFLNRHAPFLVSADSTCLAETMRKNFERKYAKWTESQGDAKALADGRGERSGNFRTPELSQTDRDNLIAHAVISCGGRVAQAWRELIETRRLSEEIIGYYLSNPSRKSYVPRSVLDSVKYEVAELEDIHHGPRQHKLNGAHISRDWAGVSAGDWWQADDGTMPVYYYVPDGNGWFTLMRGQTLLMIDLRTTRILGFVLISERNYNANSIRTLITKTADSYGLPRKGFHFENGIWKAKILKGDVSAEAMSFSETEMGLREFGLKFVHAQLPRAKPIEGIMNATQNLMEGLPGYIGRNEQTEKFERVQKQMLQVKSGKLNPVGVFMDETQWADTLETICQRYNSARQDGKMTGGLSPDEAFEKFSNFADPAVKFSSACRYLLAHHRRLVNVTGNGITLRFGSQTYNYRNAETGKIRGQKALAWFNPEMPEILTVTDTLRENPFTVAISKDVPAMEAPAEILAQENERINQHQAFAKGRYRVLKSNYVIPFRPMLADRAATQLGSEIGQQRATLETSLRQSARIAKDVHTASRKLGLVIPAGAVRRPETAKALDELDQLLSGPESGNEKENQL